jgi:hypothetical protein
MGDQEDAAWRRHLAEPQSPLGLRDFGLLVSGVAPLDVDDQLRHE